MCGMRRTGIALTQGAFKAEWIWAEQDKPNQMLCFRMVFHLKDRLKHVPAYVSAETRFRIWVNGQIAVYEGGTHRESMPGCGYYHTIELAPFLHIGKNLIAVQVWYWGNGGRNNVDSGAGGLFFDCPALGLKTEDWKVREHPAWCEVQPPKTSHLYGGHDTGWNALLDIEGWMLPDYEDSDFVPVTPKGAYPAHPWGYLYETPIPLMAYSDIQPYKTLIFENNLVRANLPYAAHVTPWFRVDAKAGKTITIHTDRWEVHGGPGDEEHVYHGHKIEYITREGIQEFEPFDWFFGEEVLYHLPDGVKLLEAGWRESGYPAKKSGVFKSSDVALDKLVQKSSQTLFVCMRENYMDCPDRERGQWIGDVSSQVPQTFYALDRNADNLTKKAIRDFIHLRRGDYLVGNVPGQHACELPSQSLNAVSDIGMIMAYAWFSGDLSVLELAYPAIKNYLNLWEITSDGRLIARKGDWQWYDHQNAIDGEVLEYGWYLLALTGAKRMAQMLSLPDVAEYDMKISALRYTASRLFWDGAGFRSESFAARQGNLYDDRAQALAILSGIASGKKIACAADQLKTSLYSTPYMEYYVLKALFMAGRDDQGVWRMMKRYAPLIENENSTLWEDFSVLGTRNHAWSGGPLTIAYQYLAGISPLKPGFERVLIAPSPAAPDKMNVTVPSPRGYIRLKVEKTSSGYTMSAKLPDDCAGIIGFPVASLPANYKLTLDESVSALPNGAFCPDVPLCARPIPQESYLLFAADGGSFTIEAKID